MTPMTDARIQILCVDDHRIVREGLALIIERQPDMAVAARPHPARNRSSCSGGTGPT